MPDADAIPTNEQYGARLLREGAAQLVHRLRDLADRIERGAENDITRAEAGEAPYSRIPADIVHEISWGLANLSLGSLITTATDADAAHARKD